MKALRLLTLALLLNCGSAAWAVEEAPYNDATSGASPGVEADAAKLPANNTVIGTITAIDAKTGAVTIDGQVVNIKPADLRMLRLRRGDQVKVTLAKGTANVSRVAILGHQDLKPAAKQPKPKAPAAATAPAAELPQ